MKLTGPVATSVTPASEDTGQAANGRNDGEEVQLVGGSDPRMANPRVVPLPPAHNTSSAGARRMMLAAASGKSGDLSMSGQQRYTQFPKRHLQMQQLQDDEEEQFNSAPPAGQTQIEEDCDGEDQWDQGHQPQDVPTVATSISRDVPASVVAGAQQRPSMVRLPLIPDVELMYTVDDCNKGRAGQGQSHGRMRDNVFRAAASEDAADRSQRQAGTGQTDVNQCCQNCLGGLRDRVPLVDRKEPSTVSYCSELSKTVPIGIKEKIWSNQYVDLVTLLTPVTQKKVGLAVDEEEGGLVSYSQPVKRITIALRSGLRPFEYSQMYISRSQVTSMSRKPCQPMWRTLSVSGRKVVIG